MQNQTLCAASRARPPLISTPWEAPTPVPTMTAVGVARPRAQGQATTSTDMPNSSATWNVSTSEDIDRSLYAWNLPAKNQASHVMKASMITWTCYMHGYPQMKNTDNDKKTNLSLHELKKILIYDIVEQCNISNIYIH